ncbi:MAG TPA: PDZ domain-containing protein [Anaerohalosphaeraceae bacterium]|jgi:hypothetical protein|nr:PDZ domain-containing protein [Anaerohalosphaeraceae bacterium]HRT48938.1 PDZ domain-containing protein [Anaerohalosphaeraceae bacterium]HRT85061.1 PDZ domain-containing protein [Anaerohalosphaeraceae bacterium]
MRRQTLISIAILSAAALFSTGCMENERIMAAGAAPSDMREAMKGSLVYLSVSANSYEMLQPWRAPNMIERNGFGCATGPNQVLTTAMNVADAAFIKVRLHGQNEYVPATVKVVDYDCNLALLEIDPAYLAVPLTPVRFVERYRRGAAVDSYWLGSNGDVITGRGHLDRAEVNRCESSFTRFLDYVVSGTSTETGKGRLFCMGDQPIGIACWANSDKQETGLIPACTINHFLEDAADGVYEGFGITGFASEVLTDPTLRRYLKLPTETKGGVYVRNVYRVGMGHDQLQQGDVVLAIDGHQIDAFGYYEDDLYGRLSYEHLINSLQIGDSVEVTIVRDGTEYKLPLTVSKFDVDEMLVPYYGYDERPEYIVTGGYVIQKLTRDYLKLWGDNFGGKAPPHLFQYYRMHAFNATAERREVVLLSYVLPAEINRGYHGLGRLVISTVNGVPIRRLRDVLEALEAEPDSAFHVIEFEQDHPTVVIPRAELAAANAMIARRYGIPESAHVRR